MCTGVTLSPRGIIANRTAYAELGPILALEHIPAKSHKASPKFMFGNWCLMPTTPRTYREAQLFPASLQRQLPPLFQCSRYPTTLQLLIPQARAATKLSYSWPSRSEPCLSCVWNSSSLLSLLSLLSSSREHQPRRCFARRNSAPAVVSEALQLHSGVFSSNSYSYLLPRLAVPAVVGPQLQPSTAEQSPAPADFPYCGNSRGVRSRRIRTRSMPMYQTFSLAWVPSP
jgi:hypothetical protein